jgi:putative flippase GtrA
MKNLVDKVLSKSIIRFGLVGALSTIIDVSLLNIFIHLHASLLVATAIGFLVASLNGYYLNSSFVFKRKHSYEGYFKFFVVVFTGLLITELIVHLLTYMNPAMNFNVAKLVAVVVVFFWNYGFSKIWAFK